MDLFTGNGTIDDMEFVALCKTLGIQLEPMQAVLMMMMGMRWGCDGDVMVMAGA